MKMEMKAGEMKMNQEQMPKMNMPMHNKSEMMQKGSADFDYKKRKTYFNYDFLKAKENTSLMQIYPLKKSF